MTWLWYLEHRAWWKAFARFMYRSVLSIPTHFPSGVYTQALEASETCGRVAWFAGLIGLSGSMRLASVLASLAQAIRLTSLIQTSHFPVGWMSSSRLVGCTTHVIVSVCRSQVNVTSALASERSLVDVEWQIGNYWDLEMK